jgi:hypothetical protein
MSEQSIPQIIELADGTKCVRLEDFLRERDEALELLASEKITRNHIIKRSVEVEKERDEARQQYDDLATEHVLAVNKLAEERDKAKLLLASSFWRTRLGEFVVQRV